MVGRDLKDANQSGQDHHQGVVALIYSSGLFVDANEGMTEEMIESVILIVAFCVPELMAVVDCDSSPTSSVSACFWQLLEQMPANSTTRFWDGL